MSATEPKWKVTESQKVDITLSSFESVLDVFLFDGLENINGGVQEFSMRRLMNLSNRHR